MAAVGQRSRRRPSMRLRLMASHLLITLLVLLLLEVPFGLFFAQRERDRLANAVERDAMVLGGLYEDALEQGVAVDLGPAQDYAARTGARVVITDEAGISIVDSGNTVPRDFSTRDEVAQALTGVRATGTRFSSTLDTGLLYVAVPVASGGQVHGAVRLSLTAAEVDERIHRFWFSLLALGLVALGAVLLVSFTTSRSVIGPLRRIERAADRLADGDLDARIDPGDAPRELHDLTLSFNTMAEQISELMVTQRSFVADASHQLRTPLTALHLRLENAVAEATEAETSDDLNAAIAEVERLNQLVNQLLALARAEGRRSAPTLVDVAAILTERAELWRSIADDRDIELSLSVPEKLTASAAEGTLEQILDNLLDNAISHTPVGGRVDMAGRPNANSADVAIAIIDHGPGLSADDRVRAFDRFWRGDQRRPGSGLGLPIVAHLAAASGGHAQLTETPGGGLTAIVTLPADP